MAEKNTSVKKWADAATDEQWIELKEWIEKCGQMGHAEGNKAFSEKYGFSISGIKPYYAKWETQKEMGEKFDSEKKALKEENAALKKQLSELKKENEMLRAKMKPDEDSGIPEYHKAEEPMKRFSFSVTESVGKRFMAVVSSLHEKHGVPKQFYSNALIEEIAKKYEK